MNSKLTLHNADCFDILKSIEPKSVDLILTDLPYGVSKNKWDSKLDLSKLWPLWIKVLKPNGVIALTATQPFTSSLVQSNLDWFRYELIWHKTVCSGQLNVKRMPLRAHESLLVFYNKPPVYNEQLTEGDPYKIKRKKMKKETETGYGKQKESKKENTGYRHATSVLQISNPRKKGEHPSMKPVELMEWVIKTYTNENGLILDHCMGTGNTGVAALGLNRRFIGVELDTDYFNIAKNKMVVFESSDSKS